MASLYSASIITFSYSLVYITWISGLGPGTTASINTPSTNTSTLTEKQPKYNQGTNNYAPHKQNGLNKLFSILNSHAKSTYPYVCEKCMYVNIQVPVPNPDACRSRHVVTPPPPTLTLTPPSSHLAVPSSLLTLTPRDL